MGPPTAEELASADYGLPIDQANAESQAEAFFLGVLKDPDSAQYQWNPVYKGYYRDAPILGGALTWGYLLEGGVNAKNSYGGYTGYKAYTFVFHNGEIALVRENLRR